MRLGQPVAHVIGRQAQRLKLAGFLAKTRAQVSRQPVARKVRCSCSTSPPQACADDIRRSSYALRKLLDAGRSLCRHRNTNLDVIAASDWLIDLGPGATPAANSSPRRAEEVRQAPALAPAPRCIGT